MKEMKDFRHPTELYTNYRDSARFTLRFIILLVLMLFGAAVYIFIKG